MGRHAVWSGNRLWGLLHLPIKELVQLYPHLSEKNLRTSRRYWATKIKKGEIEMPSNPEQLPQATAQENPVDGQLVSTIEGWWEVVTANPNDPENPIVTRVHKHSTKTRPNPELTGEEFITQAAPTIIRPHKSRPVVRTDTLTLLAGDAQIGFRAGEAFHDEGAMDLFQQAVRQLQPNNVVYTGDMIDLPAQSKYQQRRDWADTTQAAIDRYHKFLAETRANAPNARIVVVHGNHEARMDNYIQRDAQAILGLRRANAIDELSVLTLQYLVRYEDLEVESIDGYPNAAFWLEDNLKVTHGTNVAKGGSNAAKYLKEEDTTTIYGHTHRIELAYKTIATRMGQRVIAAASPGCLARTDGAVPGYHYSVDNMGHTVPKAEDWQNGLLIVNHSGNFHDILPVRMDEQGMRINGKEYKRGNV